MNYIKYLADARLINMVYPKGEEFPRSRRDNDAQFKSDVFHLSRQGGRTRRTGHFLANTMWKDHKVNKGDKNISFMVDEVMPSRFVRKNKDKE